MMTRPATESTADTQSFFSEGRDIRRRGLEIMTTLININQTNVSSSVLLSPAQLCLLQHGESAECLILSWRELRRGKF